MELSKQGAAPKRIKKVKTASNLSWKEKVTHYLKKYKHILILLLIAGIILSIGAYFYVHFVRDIGMSPAYTVKSKEGVEVMRNLDERSDLRQEFVADSQSITGFGVQFATHLKKNNGVLIAELINVETGEIVFYSRVSTMDFEDNKYHDFMFENEPVPCKPGDKFEILLSVERMEPRGGLAPYHTQGNGYYDGSFFENGREQKFDLAFKVYSGRNGFLKPLFYLFVGAAVLFFTVLYVLLFLVKAKIEKIALTVLVFFGMCYMVLLPPYAVPDEPNHISTAYHYSNVLLGTADDNKPGTINMRKDDAEFIGLQVKPDVDSYTLLKNKFFMAVQHDEMVPASGAIVKAPTFLYIPTTIGITLGRLFHLGTIPLYYLGRLFNMAAYMALIYIAMKKMPFGKMILFACGLLPVTIQQSMSFSYDVIINGLALLFIAWVLNAAYGKQNLRLLDLIVLCGLGVLLTLCKTGAYLPVCFIVLIIPIARFASRKRHHIFAGAVAGAACLAFVVYNVTLVLGATSSGSADSMLTWTGEPTQAYTISGMLADLGGTFTLFINSFITETDFYLNSSVGYLGWFSLTLTTVLSFLFIVLTLLTAVKPHNELQQVKTGTKVWIGLMAFGSILIVMLGMAIGWTPDTYESIKGVQGRYFLPIFPLVLLLIRGSNLTVKKNIDRQLVFFGMWLQLFAVLEILKAVLNGQPK